MVKSFIQLGKGDLFLRGSYFYIKTGSATMGRRMYCLNTQSYREFADATPCLLLAPGYRNDAGASVPGLQYWPEDEYQECVKRYQAVTREVLRRLGGKFPTILAESGIHTTLERSLDDVFVEAVRLQGLFQTLFGAFEATVFTMLHLCYGFQFPISTTDEHVRYSTDGVWLLEQTAEFPELRRYARESDLWHSMQVWRGQQNRILHASAVVTQDEISEMSQTAQDCLIELQGALRIVDALKVPAVFQTLTAHPEEPFALTAKICVLDAPASPVNSAAHVPAHTLKEVRVRYFERCFPKGNWKILEAKLLGIHSHHES
jgi:hypothetical protein